MKYKRILPLFLVFFLLTGFSFSSLAPSIPEEDSQQNSVLTMEQRICSFFSHTPVMLETIISRLLETAAQEESSIPYRAMWISYLEFSARDISTREKFLMELGQMFQECKDMGLNRVIVQVRPYGDALYPSEIYPWSHLITGTQGTAPDFDPLEEMVNLAHGMGLKIEAWVNPYRARIDQDRPSAFSPDNPAHDTSLVFHVGTGIYYNPALTTVQDMVVQGIVEIVEGYDIDGIHLDDYFYPSTDLTLDASDYQASGSALSQEDWRRENVNTLVKAIYEAIKDIKPEVEFGISPQGNNSNNYHSQYSDINLWLSTAGYVDYITPQLYWGFDYSTNSHPTAFQFSTIAQTWAEYPRDPSVDLYVGLAAYRIGTGDGSAATQEEWNSGENLRNMLQCLEDLEEVTGYTLFRHDFLFQNSQYPFLAQQERDNIANWNSLR